VRFPLPTPRKRPPEDSVALRVWVLAAVLCGEGAVLSTGYFDALTAALVPLLTAVAFFISHRRRRERNVLIKVALAFGALAALAVFFREALSSIYDTRVPLAQLFLWIQVIHSFDLPARKDLFYSLVSGLVLLCAGAVLSTNLFYGFFILAFFALALGALVHFRLSKAQERTGSRAPAGRFTPTLVAPGFAAVALAGLLVFALLPQRQSLNITMMLTSAFEDVNLDFSGGVQNSDYRNSGGDPFSKPPQNISPNSYHGFNPYLDLRSRGRLSDEVVMKVKSEEEVPLRGVVFNEYNGKGWEITGGDTEKLTSDEPRFDLYEAKGVEPTRGNSRRVEQIVRVQKDASNVIFGAYRPETVFFPTSAVSVDRRYSLRAPYEIPSGTTYSVISEVPSASPAELRTSGTDYPQEIEGKYTQLPSEDLQRTRELARRLTADTDNPYDAMMAMTEHLRNNYAYDLSISPQRKKMDSVEYFLFEKKRGYCEQFGSSLAVMARSLGLPARLATGYTSGEYNPFTGLYEIKASDAHAWVEVYFPGHGWQTFYPTPGFDSTPWQYEAASNFKGRQAFGFLAEKAGKAIAPAIKPTTYVVHGVASLNPLSILAAGALVLGILIFAIGALRLAAARRARKVPDSVSVADARICERYREIVAALEKANLPRAVHETPEEHARRAAEELYEPRLQRLAEIYLYARFRDTLPAAMSEEFDGLAPEIGEAINCYKERNTRWINFQLKS
jgi:transglutaminase-like putative cysteine protease